MRVARHEVGHGVYVIDPSAVRVRLPLMAQKTMGDSNIILILLAPRAEGIEAL